MIAGIVSIVLALAISVITLTYGASVVLDRRNERRKADPL